MSGVLFIAGEMIAIGFIVRRTWRGEWPTGGELVLLWACALLMVAGLIGPVVDGQ